MHRVPSSCWPMSDKWNAMPTLIFTAFFAPHAGIKDLIARGRAIISCKNKKCVVRNTQLLQKFSCYSNIIIDVRNHSVECRNFFTLAWIHVEIFLWTVQGTVWCICTDVGKKWLPSLNLFFYELPGLSKKYIRAESLCWNDLTVMKIRTTKVGIVPHVWSLPDSPTPVSIHLIKSAVFRTIGEIITKMPFPEHSGGVTIVFE